MYLFVCDGVLSRSGELGDSIGVVPQVALQADKAELDALAIDEYFFNPFGLDVVQRRWTVDREA